MSLESLPAAVQRSLIWTPLPFATQWQDYAVPYSPCGYTLDADGVVHLRGLASWKGNPVGTAASMAAITICTLPVEVRPIISRPFLQPQSGSIGPGSAHVYAFTDGSIQPFSILISQNTAVGSWVSLNGMYWQVGG